MILLTILFFTPFCLKALALDNINSKNVLVYDLDEEKILYAKAIDEKVGIASLTKIMTVLVAIENIENVDEKIIITHDMLENVLWDASIMGLKVNDEVTYKDLLMGSMLPSGADATDSLAVSISKNVDTFVELMNKKAEYLGLKNTFFYNTTGLDDSYNYTNYSTLNDLLILIKYALKNDVFRDVFFTKTYKTTNGLDLISTSEKYNKYTNYDLSFVKGSKTGYTDYSGLSLITLSDINDENIITITANAEVNEHINNHISDLNSIYNEMKSEYSKEKLFDKGDILYQIATKYAKEKTIIIKAEKDIYKYIDGKFDKDKIRIKYDGIETVNYSVKKGERLGNVSIFYDNVLVENQEVTLKDNLHFSIINFFKVNIVYEVIILLILCLIIKLLRPKNNKKKRKFRPRFV